MINKQKLEDLLGSDAYFSKTQRSIIEEVFEDFDSVRAITDRLIEKGLLTKWQAKKLLEGEPIPNLGRYRLIDCLGDDETGERFLAVHADLNRQVEIYVFSPEASKQLATQAKEQIGRCASLDHPHLVCCMEIDEIDQRLVVISERLEAESLANVDPSELGVADVARIVQGTLAGLQAAHAENMVHGDLTPENLVVGSDQVKIRNMAVSNLTRLASSSPEPLAEETDLQNLADIGLGLLDEIPSGDSTERMALLRIVSELEFAQARDVDRIAKKLDKWCSDHIPPTKSDILESTSELADSVKIEKAGSAAERSASDSSTPSPSPKTSGNGSKKRTSPKPKNAKSTPKPNRKTAQQTKQKPEPKRSAPAPAPKSNQINWGLIASALAVVVLGGIAIWKFTRPRSDRDMKGTRSAAVDNVDLEEGLGGIALPGGLTADDTAGDSSPHKNKKKQKKNSPPSPKNDLTAQPPSKPFPTLDQLGKPSEEASSGEGQQPGQNLLAHSEEPTPEVTDSTGPEPTPKTTDPAMANTTNESKSSEVPGTPSSASETPGPSPTPPGPAPVAPKYPFHQFVKHVDLPPINNTEPLKIGDLVIDSSFLLGVQMQSTPEGSRKKAIFDLKRSPDDKKRWKVFHRVKEHSDPTEVAQFWYTGTAFYFQWLPAAQTVKDVDYLRNTLLKLHTPNGQAGWLTLRTPVPIKDLKLTDTAWSAKAKTKIDWLPNPKSLIIELAPFEGEEIVAHCDPEYIQPRIPGLMFFTRKPEDALIFLQVKGQTRSSIVLDAQMILNNNGQPTPLNPESFAAYKASLFQAGKQAEMAAQGTKNKQQKKQYEKAAEQAKKKFTICQDFESTMKKIQGKAIPIRIYFLIDKHKVLLGQTE